MKASGRDRMVIIFWMAMALFYLLAILGRTDSFLLDDLPITQDKCIRSLQQLKHAGLLNQTRASQACPNAVWVRVEHPHDETRALMVVHSGSDGGITLLFDKDGRLIEVQGGRFHPRMMYTPYALLYFIISLPMMALLLLSRPTEHYAVRNSSILYSGTLLTYLSGVAANPLDQPMLLINGVIFIVALIIGVWAVVDVYKTRHHIRDLLCRY